VHFGSPPVAPQADQKCCDQGRFGIFPKGIAQQRFRLLVQLSQASIKHLAIRFFQTRCGQIVSALRVMANTSFCVKAADGLIQVLSIWMSDSCRWALRASAASALRRGVADVRL